MLSRIVVTFKDSTIEYAVRYEHEIGDVLPTPGSKARITRVATMAAGGLRRALDSLDTGAAVWGGFAQGRAEATDHVLIERKENAA